jgi:Leucine-rich repeat (LRR) protein
MKRIAILLLVLLSFFRYGGSQVAPHDTMYYYRYRKMGLDSMNTLNYVDALKKFRDAQKWQKGVKKPDIEKLINRAEDSIRNLINQLKYSNRRAFSAQLEAERAKTRTDSALHIADKIVKSMYFYSGKYAVAYNGKEYGFIDKNGNNVIKYEYTRMEPFDEYTGYARGDIQNVTYLIDTAGVKYKLATFYIDPKVSINFKAIHIENDYKLDWKSIRKCDSIEILILNNNSLKTLPIDIDKLNKLKSLAMYNNEIQSIPASIRNLGLLNFLSFFGNSLTELPNELFNLKNLKKLDLGKNGLTIIPEEISQLKNLKWLSFADNSIKEVPGSIAGLSELTVLLLRNNKLKVLPDNFGQLKNLNILYLQGNEFDTLPKVVGELKNLTFLGFTFPANGFIHQEILDLPKLDLVDYIDTCKRKGFDDLAAAIRVSSLKKSFSDIISYGNLSWYCMLSGDIKGAIVSGERYRREGGDNIGGLSNLAMAYLWSGRYQDAFEIYSRYKNEKEFRQEGRLGKEIFLKDIEDITVAGVKPLRAEDLDMIISYLGKN